jgi:hypothetical protein
MRKTFRYLRITVSVLSLASCALLVVLWVRSYWARESFRAFLGKQVLSIPSGRGELGIGIWGWQSNYFGWTAQSVPENEKMTQFWPFVKGQPPLSSVGIRWSRWVKPPGMTLVVVPYWLLVLTTATLGAATWVKYSRRFSLRTMLIAWTLVTIVLGLIAWRWS